MFCNTHLHAHSDGGVAHSQQWSILGPVEPAHSEVSITDPLHHGDVEIPAEDTETESDWGFGACVCVVFIYICVCMCVCVRARERMCVSPEPELIRRLQLLSVCRSKQVDHRQSDGRVHLTGLTGED